MEERVRHNTGPPQCAASIAAEAQILIDRLDVAQWKVYLVEAMDGLVDPALVKRCCTQDRAAAWYNDTYGPNPKPLHTIREIRKSILKYFKVSDQFSLTILDRYKIPKLPGSRHKDSGYHRTLDFKVAIHLSEEFSRLTDRIRYRDIKAAEQLQVMSKMPVEERSKSMIRLQEYRLREKEDIITTQEDLLKRQEEMIGALKERLEDLQCSNAGLRQILQHSTPTRNDIKAGVADLVEAAENLGRLFARGECFETNSRCFPLTFLAISPF